MRFRGLLARSLSCLEGSRGYVKGGGTEVVELGRQIRTRWPDIKVVLTSGYSHVLVDDTRHGFDLLHKPYSINELSRLLHDVRQSGRMLR